MACRVFRAVKLGLIKDPQNSTSLFTTTVGRSHGYDSGNEIVLKHRTFDNSRSMPVSVEITQTMDIAEDSHDGCSDGKQATLEDGSTLAFNQV